MHLKAVRHLRSVDPALRTIIDRVGRCTLEPNDDGTHFGYVMRCIVYQQLSGTAAATIYRRVTDLYGGRHPTPGELLDTPGPALRAVGLSGRKVEYVKDLAARTIDGTLAVERLHELSDDEAMEALVGVHGIGRWTAQMVLMFRLGRPDVFPELDLGVRKAVKKLLRLRSLPTPERMRKIGERWAPNRTVATWYLWRSLELTQD